MSESKNSLKEAIAAIRGMSATFRAFANADAAISALMGLESTKESIDLRIQEAQKELDGILSRKKNIQEELDKENLALDLYRTNRMKDIDSEMAAYASESNKKNADAEHDLNLKIAKLEEKKASLESDVADLSDVKLKRDAVIANMNSIVAAKEAEQKKLDGIKEGIAALKNKLW